MAEFQDHAYVARNLALINQMREASQEIQDRVAALIDDATQGVVTDHRAQMPRSGRGKRAFRDRPLADRVIVRAFHSMRKVVVSDAPHLHLVELGTVSRDTRPRPRKSGRRKAWSYVAHSTGVMPKMGPIFIPLVIRRRAQFLAAAEALIGNREF